jgi:hypothetical protein
MRVTQSSNLLPFFFLISLLTLRQTNCQAWKFKKINGYDILNTSFSWHLLRQINFETGTSCCVKFSLNNLCQIALIKSEKCQLSAFYTSRNPGHFLIKSRN